MPTEIVVEAEDRPGTMAALGELLGSVEVNISAAAAFAHDGRAHFHLVVAEADRALAALKDDGWHVRECREVLTVTLDDRPGELGRLARHLASAGINISSLYIAGASGGEKELVIAVDDLHSARRRV